MSTASFNYWKNTAGTAMQTVLQVIQTVKTDTFSAGPNGTWTDVTGLSVTITPLYVTSKILVIPTVIGSGTGQTPKIRIVRGSTAIAVGATSGNKQSATMGSYLNKDINQVDTYTHLFLDSPATTSPTTYKLQVNSDSATVWYCNRSPNDSDTATGGRYVSQIMVMEIAQ